MANKTGKGDKRANAVDKNRPLKSSSYPKGTPKKILEFEKLISGFSAALIAAPQEDLEDELNRWIKKFVEFLDVDRCVVNEIMDDGKSVRRLLYYTDADVDVLPVPEGYLLPAGVIDELKKGLVIKASKIPDDLPQSFRNGIIEKTKTKSVVIIPFSADNRVIGTLLFASFRKERKWSENLLRRIKLIAEIIANAIIRIRSHKALIELTEHRKLLEETYSSVIKNANLGFMIIDLTGHKIIDVNDEYCRMSGYTREELIGKNTWEIDASMNQDKIIEEGKLVSVEGAIHIKTSHKRKDGTIFDVEISSNLFSKDPNIVYSFIRDITDINRTQKELEDRLQFEEIISEFSTELISPDDYNKKLLYWLKRFVEYLKVDRGVIVEHSIESKRVKVLMQYSVPEIDLPPLDELYDIPEEEILEFQKGMFLRAEKIPDDIPELLRGGLIEKDNTRSVIIVPLSTGSKAVGSLTFATYREEHKWSDDMVRRIRLIGEIIANTILRQRSSDALIEEVKRRKMLEEKYSSILKNASVGFWITDFSSLSILDVNDEYCRMTGYSRDELLSKKIWEIDASGDPQKIMKERSSMVDQNGIIHLETRHKRKDGTFIDVSISANIFAEEGIVCNFISDVTEIKKAQIEKEERLAFEKLVSEFSASLMNIKLEEINEELKKWLIKFVDFLDIGRGIINEYDYDNNTMMALVNYTAPDSVSETLPHDTVLKTPDSVMNEFKKGAMIRAEKIPEDLPDSFRGWIIEKHNTKSLVVVPLISESQIIGNLTFAGYKKERKWPDDIFNRIKLIGEIIAGAILRLRAHEALLDEMKFRKMIEERYTSIIKTANVGFMISDMNANILDVNDAYCEMSGYNRDELLRMKIYNLDVSGDPEKVDNDKGKIFETGSFHHETSHIRKDGSVINVFISANRLKNENIIYSFIRDVTELRKTEEDLENRLKFEQLMSEFSAALINLKLADIGEDFKPWLKKFVDFLEVERGIINEYDYDNRLVNAISAYTVPDIDVPPTDRRNEAPPLIMDKLSKGDIIRAERIPDDLPPIFNESIIRRHKTKSILIVPLLAEHQIIGNLTFATYTKEHKWSDEFVRRIKLIGEIIANAVLRKRASDALIKEMERRHLLEERYTSIIKNANVGFMITDLNQNILVVNDEYCRLSGFSRDELVKMKISDIDFSEDREKVDADGKITVEHGSLFHQSRHIHKSGRIYDVEVNSNYLENEKIIFSFIRDVTELNQAKKELEERLKFEELVSEFSAALINVKLYDIKTKLDDWLRRFSELLGVDRWAIGEYENNYGIYRFICAYSNPDVYPVPPDYPMVMINDGRYGLEKYLMKGENIKLDSSNERLPEDLSLWAQQVLDDGTKSILMLPLLAGDTLLGSMVIATLTHEKRWTDEIVRRLKLVAEIFTSSLMREKTDIELENYRKHLEKMVEERTASLEKAQKELLVSEKMATLGKLTATVSHELRNPLGTIRTSVFAIGKRLKGEDEKVTVAFDRAERNIKRCDLIIDELLNYSRVKELVLEPTALDEWIKDVLDETKPQKGIAVKTDLNAGASISIDRERFRQSIVNILTNAYQAIEEKKLNEPGNVLISTFNEKDKIIIKISDDGVGFDMAVKSKLFEPLFSTKAFGVGLGLSITRQIIEQHGFKMDMHGEPGKGASVTITIPIRDIE